MTREKAIEILLGNRDVFKSINFGSTYSINTALDMAIEALEQEPTLDKLRAAVEKIETYDGLYVDRAYVLEIIDNYKTESEG